MDSRSKKAVEMKLVLSYELLMIIIWVGLLYHKIYQDLLSLHFGTKAPYPNNDHNIIMRHFVNPTLDIKLKNSKQLLPLATASASPTNIKLG